MGSGALRNRSERNFRIGVDAALQPGEEGIVGTPMELPEKPGSCRIDTCFPSDLPETVEEHVDNDNIGVQTVNSRRNDEVELKSMNPAAPRAHNPIQKKPGKKLQKVGTRDGRNFMPKDSAGIPRACGGGLRQRETFNALGVKMNLAMLVAREVLQHLGESTLGAMPAINER